MHTLDKMMSSSDLDFLDLTVVVDSVGDIHVTIRCTLHWRRMDLTYVPVETQHQFWEDGFGIHIQVIVVLPPRSLATLHSYIFHSVVT